MLPFNEAQQNPFAIADARRALGGMLSWWHGLGTLLASMLSSRPTADGQPKSTKLCLQPEVPFKAPGRLEAAPGGPEDMLVTWLDQEARADERYEIRESTSLGQCHVIACVRQAIQLAAV